MIGIRQLTSGSAVVLVVTIFNRGTGYLRDLLMTAALGASSASQIFVFAFRVFGVVRALAAESAIPTVVIDRYVRHYPGVKSADGRAFLDADWGSWWLLAGFWALLLAAATPLLMSYLLPNDTYRLLSWSFILLFSVLFGIGLSAFSVAAVYSSLFQAQGRFFAHSALASVPNIVLIVLLISVLLLKIEDIELLSIQVAIALLTAGLLQIVFSSFALRQKLSSVIWPFRSFHPRWLHSNLAIANLAKMAPISIFNVSSPLAAILATMVLVNHDLNITYFFVAERLVQLIPGTIGYAVGIVILPISARARHGSVNIVLQMTVIIAILLIVGFAIAEILSIFSTQIISLLYRHLNFTAGDASKTSLFLAGIAISVPALLVEPVLTNRLFAQMSMRTNQILIIGSITICAFVWRFRVGLGVLGGGAPETEACAVFVSIIVLRVLLLLALNISPNYNDINRDSPGGR